MNIYRCYRVCSGVGLTAMVEANTEDEAIKELGWSIDDDTAKVVSPIELVVRR